MKVGISACLGFSNCRYDGGCFNNFDLNKAELFLKRRFQADNIEFIPVCPEVLGKLATPRPPAEIFGGDGYSVWNNQAKVLNNDGIDVTEYFKLGAVKILNLAKELEIQIFILKENSPSCGSTKIYSGNFDNIKRAGKGVTSALLQRNEITVLSDEMF